MDRQKILDALKVIQDTCKANTCGSCPLRGRYKGCDIANDSPEEWKLTVDNEFWRAFDD